MKILHTADIHLNEMSDNRWQTLCQIVELGSAESIDAMVISGDLFDADIDAIKLRGNMRDIFSGLKYDIYIIPGNHDSKSFQDRAFFGSNVKVIRSVKDVYEFDEVTISGIPFQNIQGVEIYRILCSISERLNSEKCNILLYHGELLDSYYSRRDFGDEGESRYMPVSLDFFSEMNFDYVLSGHFHTNYNALEFDKQNGKGYFVYPGSPVSITQREIGQRKVNLFYTGKTPNEVLINTPYYEEVNVRLDPFSDTDPITAINQRLDLIDTNASILLSVSGYFNSSKHGIDETKLSEEIEKIKTIRNSIKESNFKSIDLSKILEDDIFKAFKSKLQSTNKTDSEKSDMREYFLRAMTETLI